MTKKVIVLYGVADVGKSTTIKMMYNLLKTKYKPTAIKELFLGADIKIVLTINGTKIGIESQGDPSGRLEDSLKLFISMHCQIIVCATRSRGQTVRAVENLEPAFKALWLEQVIKTTQPRQQRSNLQTANKIVREINKMLG